MVAHGAPDLIVRLLSLTFAVVLILTVRLRHAQKLIELLAARLLFTLIVVLPLEFCEDRYLLGRRR